MIYSLSIDWLSFYCSSLYGEVQEFVTQSIEGTFSWEYEHAEHGTRHYKQLIYVRKDGEDIFEVQQVPCSNLLQAKSMIIKVCNRFLYSKGLFFYIDMFCKQQNIEILNLSRVDLCADFNYFYKKLHPITLISGFLNSTYRHVGRGLGSSHFNHSAKREGKFSRSFLNYTGLSFGTNQSACKVYLYDKSFELMTVKDKPHIRQLWKQCGLVNDKDTHVWRLEISIKSKGMKFRDKSTQDVHKLSCENMQSNSYLSLIYHTFVKSLFSFVRNHSNIKNITREPRIQLFSGEPYLDRCVLSSDSAGNRTERILIKQLWQMSETYRGNDIVEDEGISKILAHNLAANTNLSEWLKEKSALWKKPNKK